MRPEICPVCNGKGTVSPGFYPDDSTSNVRQICRACNGRGIIICGEDRFMPRKPIIPWRLRPDVWRRD